MTHAQKVSPLTDAEREAVSRVNIIVKVCAEVVLEAINAGIPEAVCHATSSYMWSLDVYCCLLNLGPAMAQLGLAANFDNTRPSGAGTWTSRLQCYQGAVCNFFRSPPIRRVKHERQGISLTCGVCETRWLLGSSVHAAYHEVAVASSSAFQEIEYFPV